MGQFIGYAILAGIAIGAIIFAVKYLLSLGKIKKVDFTTKLEEIMATQVAPELKLEVVKNHSSKKKAVKKSAAKPIAKKKTKTTTIKPT
jgi:hypothetical protein